MSPEDAIGVNPRDLCSFFCEGDVHRRRCVVHGLGEKCEHPLVERWEKVAYLLLEVGGLPWSMLWQGCRDLPFYAEIDREGRELSHKSSEEEA